MKQTDEDAPAEPVVSQDSPVSGRGGQGSLREWGDDGRRG